AIKGSRPCGLTIFSPPKLAAIASSVSYISLPHWRRRSSYYLPCPLSLGSLLHSYSTSNIFANDNDHLTG
ncbi:unnamed protein product, partial [Eruca vesicaria subsp. sativa]|nr:unnamed protein product [Eruca vesicaria subsp. sativa]